MTNVRLLPATVEHLVTLQSDPTAFGQLIGNQRKVTFVAPPR
jgi:hypothetical protein